MGLRREFPSSQRSTSRAGATSLHSQLCFRRILELPDDMPVICSSAQPSAQSPTVYDPACAAPHAGVFAADGGPGPGGLRPHFGPRGAGNSAQMMATYDCAIALQRCQAVISLI